MLHNVTMDILNWHPLNPIPYRVYCLLYCKGGGANCILLYLGCLLLNEAENFWKSLFHPKHIICQKNSSLTTNLNNFFYQKHQQIFYMQREGCFFTVPSSGLHFYISLEIKCFAEWIFWDIFYHLYIFANKTKTRSYTVSVQIMHIWRDHFELHNMQNRTLDG